MGSFPKTFIESIQYFSDIDNCITFLASRRWKDGVACPTCGRKDVVFMASRRLWQCKTHHPKSQFSIKTGTILEDSPIGLNKWLPVIWLLSGCKNGISSCEVARHLGVSQKTAWFMLHRVRYAMQDEDKGGKLGGPMGEPVEVDETYIGGKARNMHKDRKAKLMQGRRGGSVGKAIVLGVLERHGEVRAKVIDNTTNPEIRQHVKENVEFGSRIHSDEAAEKWGMDQHYIHEMVNHAADEYVRGNVHTNGIENFWSLLKRGIGGTYVSVEPFHLFRYVDEQAFRYNNRKDADGEPVTDAERFELLCEKITGKRLTYDELIAKEAKERADNADF